MILVTNNEGECGIDLAAQMITEGHECLDAVEAGIRIVEANSNCGSGWLAQSYWRG